MERPNLSAIGKIIKEKWNCSDLISSHHDHPCEIPWAVKNYACSFCKRQFKSAQALGGHMNVHRRERARLRLFPPLSLAESCPNNLQHNPNPSPSPNPNKFSSKLLPHYYTPHSMLSPPTLTSLSLPDPLASTDIDAKAIFDFPRSSTIPFFGTPQGRDTTTKSMKAPVFEDEDHLKGFSEKADYFKGVKRKNIIRLDLEMGLLKDQKEDVDLELRLGCF